MARSLKWQAAPAGIREMTDAEIDYIVNRVLVTFAADDTGPGCLTLTSTSNVSIGSFTDTYRTEAIGTHPTTGPTGSDVTTVYQNRNITSTAASTRPMKWQAAPAGIRELTDEELNTTIISRAAANLVASGIGSYKLQPGIPTGGTWVSKITINDQYGGSNGVTTANSFIWRKTADTVPTVVRPMKWQAAPAGIREMSDAEIQTLATQLREYIRTTAVGSYALQAAAPLTGTWVSVGSITDTRQIVSDSLYRRTNPYAGTYQVTIGYTGTYRRTIGYTGTYRRRIGYVTNYAGFNGPTYYRFADYTGTYYQFADYTGTYYQFATYAGTYFQFADYAGGTIQAGTENVSTITLWLRTA